MKNLNTYLNKNLNNFKKFLKNNLISFLIIIILVILIIYFLIDIKKNNIINENFTNSEEENILHNNDNSNVENENSNSLTGEEIRSMYMMEGETSEERKIRSMMEGENESMIEGETFSEMNTMNEESDKNYLSSIVETTSEENITNSVARNMLSEEENSILIEEEIGMEKPSTQSFRFNNPTPININVSYNTKNSINDSNIADDDVYSNVKNINQSDDLSAESTIGTSSETLSSLSSNNSNTPSNGLSWSLTSDYYIPGVTNVNQNYNSEENETTNSYPYLYEQPWSNYKSGDN